MHTTFEIDPDLPGKAIYDFYFTPHRYQLFVHDQFGPKVEMPVSYYFRNLDTMPELEQVAIENCRGKTLDIGAAAGSHAIELQRKGIPVTALEISQNACKVMNERGVVNVICEDFFKFSGQKFDTLLLLMNGIGISSTVDGLRKFFEKADELLLPNGQIIFDSCDIDYMYEEFQMPSDRYYGEVKCRYEYHELLTDWFGWLYIDQFTMQEIAEEYGFDVKIIFEDDSNQYLAILTKNI